MEDVIMLSALLKLIGGDGTNSLSDSNPLPVSTTGGAGNWAVDSSVETVGTAVNTQTILTIPAVAGKSIVLGSATADLFSNTARTASATRPILTITGFGTTVNKFLPNSATAVGQLESLPLTLTPPQKAQKGAAVVITLPAYATCVGRLQATYTYV